MAARINQRTAESRGDAPGTHEDEGMFAHSAGFSLIVKIAGVSLIGWLVMHSNRYHKEQWQCGRFTKKDSRIAQP
jgi:hypothetical protein